MKCFSVGESGSIPALGLGTWKSNKGEAGKAVAEALKIGYRHIDCAHIYMNEKEIGEAFAESMAEGVVKREELWITSKLWNNAHAKNHVQTALKTTLRDLRLDYLDLYLIHWPIHFKPGIVFPRKPEDFVVPDGIPVMETWQALEKMVEKGLCRYIGVCNFNLEHIKALHKDARIKPAMNQIELHPYLPQTKIVEFCKANNIRLTAYSPLGSGDRPAAMKSENEPSLLNHPKVVEIGAQLGFSPAQVLLAWGLTRETVVIPKSVNPERLKQNLAAADLTLPEDVMVELAKLDLNFRYVHGKFFQMPGSPYTTEWIWGE
jgi:alcohol dehydrogenase (NADP+)